MKNDRQDIFIKKAEKTHNNKYDYSKVVYNKMQDKVEIICPKHGCFTQSMSKHISKKQGCPICAIEERSQKQRSDLNELIEKCNKIHNNKYDYSQVKFKTIADKVEIICPKHGSFFQKFYDHIHGCGCPTCIHIKSSNELEIFNFVKNYFPDAISGDKKMLKGKELDIFIPSKNIAIEYNGLRWHSEAFGKDKNYHLDKLENCLECGIKLIQIFEDEYINHKDIVLNKIKHILGINNDLPKIMGRKCNVTEISCDTANEFLNKFHIEGYTSSTICLGAFHRDILVGVMSFTLKEKKSLTWEINRFASNYNYICQGIGGKLFNYFIQHFDFKKIISVVDRRWSINYENNLYIKLKFNIIGFTKPNYSYILINNPTDRINKFDFRKKNLSTKYDSSLFMSETEIAKSLRYSKIWDCGLIKYEYMSE